MSFLCLVEQIPTNWGTSNNRNIFSGDFGGQASTTKEGHAPSQGSKGRSFPPFRLLEAPGGPWCLLACGYTLPVSASVVTWSSLLCLSQISLLFLL